jgi:hypothetical protein
LARFDRLLDLHRIVLGPSWEPGGLEEPCERSAGGDVGRVRLEVELGGSQRGVPSDALEHMDGHSGVSHPRQAGVSEVVAAEVFVSQFCDDLVPVRGVAEHCGGDSAAARSGEHAGLGPALHRFEPLEDDVSYLCDERDLAGAFALGAFVLRAARPGGFCRRRV